jgi:hypothetical protein
MTPVLALAGAETTSIQPGRCALSMDGVSTGTDLLAGRSRARCKETRGGPTVVDNVGVAGWVLAVLGAAMGGGGGPAGAGGVALATAVDAGHICRVEGWGGAGLCVRVGLMTAIRRVCACQSLTGGDRPREAPP